MSSNLIKGYTLNYDRNTVRHLDLSKNDEIINQKAQELYEHQKSVIEAAQNFGFIPGIAAEQLSEEGMPVSENGEMLPDLQAEPDGFATGGPEDDDIPILLTKAELEEYANRFRYEVAPAESDDTTMQLALEQIHEEADSIIADAKSQAMKIIADAVEKAKKEAEKESEVVKSGIMQAASTQGYEDGVKRAREELNAEHEALESKRRELEEKYERQVADLEPAFVKILQEYLKKITGMSYAKHSEVFRYLIDKGIKNAPIDKEFTIYLSNEDHERFSPEFEKINAGYSDRFNLNFSVDHELSEGSFRLENETTIVECGLDAELNGLLESLNLLM